MAAPVDKALEMLGGHNLSAHPPSLQTQQPNAQHASLPNRPASSDPRANPMDPRQQSNYHVPVNNQNVRPMGSVPDKPHQSQQYQPQGTQQQQQQQQRGDMNPLGFAIPTASELKKALGDTLSTAPGEPVYTPDTHQKNGAGQPADNSDQRFRLEGNKGGYERKIGRGTSWRRDHDDRAEGDYTVRGRGRGSGGPGRGRGGHYQRDSSRSSSGDYPPYRQDYDHRPSRQISPPPHSAPHRLPVEPRPLPPPDPYFESRGTFTASPPRFDTRREYLPESGAGYYDDYRRGGYDPRGPLQPPLHSSHPLPPSGLDSRRSYDRDGYDRRPDSAEYVRTYPPRSRDARNAYPPLPARSIDSRYPSDIDPRYRDEGQRQMEESRMIPLTPPPDSRRPPPGEPLEYRERRSSVDRSYARVIPLEVEQSSLKSDPTNHTQKLATEDSTPNIEAQKHKDLIGDSAKGTANTPMTTAGAGSTLKNATQPPSTVAAGDPIRSFHGRSDSKLLDDYDRERPHHIPPHPSTERYVRENHGRAPPPYYEGRRRSDDRHPDPRDYRGAYEKDYYNYPPPSSDYRGREPYPPSAMAARGPPPPMDYARGPPPPRASYDERYMRSPMNLDPAMIREGYRDYPARDEYGTKRKYSDPEYADAHYGDYRARENRYPERVPDYPAQPPYDYDDREPKRFRGPLDPRDPGYDRPPPAPYDDRGPPPRDYPPPSYPSAQGRPLPPYHPLRERTRPHGRYFLVKTSTAENIEKSRETGRWGVPVKDVEIFREAYKAGPVTLLFALDESGRFSGYAEMTSDVGTVGPLAWMEEHCSPVGAAFEVRHRTTDDVRTNTTAKARNYSKDGKPIRFGQDGQEISPKEACLVIDELERLSGPENAEKRTHALVFRGGPPRGIARGRGRGGRGGASVGGYDPGPTYRGGYDRGRGRGRGRD